MTGSRTTCRAAAGIAEEVEVGHGRGVAGGLDRAAADHQRPDQFRDPGSRVSTRERLVSGPRATIVTSRGWALIVSQITFSRRGHRASGTCGRSSPPRPSGPCTLKGRAGSTPSAAAAPIRGSRGGSSRPRAPGDWPWPARPARCPRRPSRPAPPAGDQEGDGQGHGIVDSGIAVDDQFAGHRSAATRERKPSVTRGRVGTLLLVRSYGTAVRCDDSQRLYPGGILLDS